MNKLWKERRYQDMGKRELDTEEALFDSKAQKDFIKNEIGDLSSARITQWGFGVVALVGIALFIGFIFLPYVTIRNNTADGEMSLKFYTLAFGTYVENTGRHSGQFNVFFIAEFVLFIIAAMLPLFSRRHEKALVITSTVILSIVGLFMMLNFSNYLLKYSFTRTYRNEVLFKLETTNAKGYVFVLKTGYYLLPAVTFLTILAQWLTYGYTKKVAIKRLYNNAKFGKKLLNY